MNLDSVLYIVKGVPITVLYTLSSFILGFFLGIWIALGRVSSNKFFSSIASIYVSVFRGTPVLVQLSIVYYVTPSITGYTISIFEAGVIAFSLNSAAYITEILRAGIASIDKSQFESAHALNIPYFYIMKDIILPQAIRNALPSLVNEITGLLKETAILSFFGEQDIMKRAEAIYAAQYTYLMPLLAAAFCYYVLVLLLNNVALYMEKKFKIR